MKARIDALYVHAGAPALFGADAWCLLHPRDRGSGVPRASARAERRAARLGFRGDFRAGIQIRMADHGRLGRTEEALRAGRRTGDPADLAAIARRATRPAWGSARSRAETAEQGYPHAALTLRRLPLARHPLRLRDLIGRHLGGYEI